MDDLLIAPQTRRQLTALAADMPHAVLFVGAAGMGKRTVSLALATQLTSAQNVAIVEPDDKGTIGIDNIRQLYARTRAKQRGRQVVLVDHAEAMGVEAQNAFLKLLEEPRAGVSFMLTAPTDDALLPTITSRVQTVALPRLNHKFLHDFATQRAPHLQPQELAQLLFIADGRPAMLARLLRDPETFAHYTGLMKQAKDMLAAGNYQKLARVPELAKNKEDAVALLEAMARMLHTQLLRAQNDQWLALADAIQQTLARLAQNGNVRAQLTALFATF